MKIKSYLAALVFLPLSLHAQDLNEKLNQLKKVGDDFAGAEGINSSSPAMKGLVMEQREFSNNFGPIQSYVQDNNYDQAIRTLQRWLKRTQNAQVKAALEDLLKGLKEEQTARLTQLATRLDTVLQAAGKKLAAAKTPDQVSSVQSELEEFRDTELSGGDRSTRALSERISRALNFVNYWQQVLMNESNGDYPEALQSLNGLRRNSSITQLLSATEIAAKYQTLLDQYLKRDASEKTASPIAQVIAATMAKVKTPADAANAAAFIAELTAVSSGADNRIANQLQNQLNEIAQIQSEIAAGNYSRAINYSNYSSSGYGQNPYLKQIVALKEELRRQALAIVIKNAEQPKEETASPVREMIAKIMANVKTPADAAAAHAAITELASLGISGSSRLLNAVQNQLNEVVQMDSNYESGAYARVISGSGFGNSYGPTPYTKPLQAFKDELRARAVAAANDLPDLGTPKANESFPAFVRRLADEAYTKKDWERLYTLLTVYSTVTGGGCARSDDMQGAVAAYLSGVQLEAAQQFGDAVLKYTFCVSKLGKLVPRAEATAALERLRREHPEAFAPTGNLR